MKKLLILPLLALLTSCVTYYHPETALEDGVYYAEDDPKYVVYQGGYPGAAYYPWASLDYFYMGYSPYPIYPYYTGFPFGIVYSYYPYGYWGNYHGYCRHDVVCGGSPHQRYAGNERGDRQARDNEASDNEASDDEYRGDDPDSLKSASGTGRSYHSYVSAMPAGYSGNRGMVIRSSEATKIGKSRVQPVQSGSSSNGIIVIASPSVSTTTPVAAGSSGAVGTRVISERPAQTLAGGSSDSSGSSRSSNVPNSSRSSNSSGPSRSSTSRSRPSSGSSNRSRSSARSSSPRSSKVNRSVPREKRD